MTPKPKERLFDEDKFLTLVDAYRRAFVPMEGRSGRFKGSPASAFDDLVEFGNQSILDHAAKCESHIVNMMPNSETKMVMIPREKLAALKSECERLKAANERWKKDYQDMVNVDGNWQKSEAEWYKKELTLTSELAEARKLIEYIGKMLHELPSGIDEEADENNASPDDATAHIGGLIWQRVTAFLSRTADGKEKP